jgi:hypothetical protein
MEMEFSMKSNLTARLLTWLLGLTFLALCSSSSGADGETRVVCNVHEGPCSATLSGAEVILDIGPKPVRAMQDLTFVVTLPEGTAAASLQLDLGMPGMQMGRNRVILKPEGKSVFRGNGVIVRCPSGRRTWKANLMVPGKGEVEFIFDVIY